MNILPKCPRCKKNDAVILQGTLKKMDNPLTLSKHNAHTLKDGTLGADAGATIGTLILPVVGTIVGAIAEGVYLSCRRLYRSK